MSSPDSTISFCAPVVTVRRRGFEQPASTRDPSSSSRRPGLAARVGVFAFGLVSYAVFFATFLYAFGWVSGFATPTSLDAPRPQNAAMPWPVSMLINVALLLVFALQHSVMARPRFKSWVTRFIPEAAERSTYVLLSSAALMLIFWLWQPLGGVVWSVNDPAGRWALLALMACGWMLVLVSTFLINHFDLFGLRQVWLHLIGKPYTNLKFQTPGPYRLVRHPLYVGWLVGFWATPTMTAAHLLFAVVTTAYILAAIRWEERDLVEFHGDEYRKYQREVPMLLPGVRGTGLE